MARGMERHQLIHDLFVDGIRALWCPLLTHYIVRRDRVTVDRRRMAAHMRTLTPYIDQFLLGGSTGDGWDLTPQQFDDLLTFAAHESYWPLGARFLVGALGRTTTDVIRRGQTARSKLGDGRAPGFIGLAVCPPVMPEAMQREIHEHYARICASTETPIAVYQLPQVTGCRIEVQTLRSLVEQHANIFLLKDSSGDDDLAASRADLDGVIVVRGAEGRYAESLRSGNGPYDGLLLASTNFLAYSLRSVVEMADAGEAELARRRSRQMTAMIQRLLGVVAACPVGNGFSNMARAVDHLLAHGQYWPRVEPPMLYDGSRLPDKVLKTVAAIYDEMEGIPEQGYFLHRYIGLE
jgi:4-hydroxy-tetrahydrodipicolinate synthase